MNLLYFISKTLIIVAKILQKSDNSPSFRDGTGGSIEIKVDLHDNEASARIPLNLSGT